MPVAQEEDEWFEVSKDMFREPHERPRKLKLCADASVPQSFVDGLRQAGIPVHTASKDGVATHSDSSVAAWCSRHDRVLVTFDEHFWDDRRFPLQSAPGIIFVNVSPSNVEAALQAFGLVYWTLARNYSLNRWQGIKIRATLQAYVLKMRNYAGRISQYTFKVESGRLLARDIIESCGFAE